MPPNRPDVDAMDSSGKEATPVVNYSRFINDFASERQPSLVRELRGLPNPSTFPFQEINIKLENDDEITMSGKDLFDSLQYMPTQGYPPLVEYLKDFQRKIHNPPLWDNCDILITPGSQDGISKAIEMSLEKGEPILVQHPVYSGTECVIRPFKADVIPIEQDENGLRPDLLKKALQSRLTPLEAFTRSKGVPKLLYVNTTGANPTGVTLSTERRREIYRIACEYNLIILEDDPYYYLHFMEELPESFLSMDTEGRVIRFDSFSKIVSPGLRVGFVTGPKELIRRMELHLQASSLCAPSFSQVIIYNILMKWGMEGLFNRFEFIQKFYKERRDAMVAAAEKHLGGLAEWYTPTAGMFLWIKVNVLRDVRHLVTEECLKRGVLFVTGHAYIVKPEEPCQYVRACFSIASFTEIEEGMIRLADAIRSEIVAEPLRSLSLSLGT